MAKIQDMKKTFIKNPWTCALVWGLIGALLMQVSMLLPVDKTWKKETFMLIFFALSLIGLLSTIRVRQNQKKFLVILSASLITWMLMPVALHIVRAIRLGGYSTWWIIPFFQMLGLGLLFCAPLVWLTIRLRKKTLTYQTNADPKPL